MSNRQLKNLKRLVLGTLPRTACARSQLSTFAIWMLSQDLICMSNTFGQVKKNTVQICTAKISQGTFTLARISASGTKAHWTVLTQNACD